MNLAHDRRYTALARPAACALRPHYQSIATKGTGAGAAPIAMDACATRKTHPDNKAARHS